MSRHCCYMAMLIDLATKALQMRYCVDEFEAMHDEDSTVKVMIPLAQITCQTRQNYTTHHVSAPSIPYFVSVFINLVLYFLHCNPCIIGRMLRGQFLTPSSRIQT
jgi:hypothetical protein